LAATVTVTGEPTFPAYTAPHAQPELNVESTHNEVPVVAIPSDCAPAWKRLVPYSTTPVPKTTDATKMINVVSTVLIAFLFFILKLVNILVE